MYDTCTGTTPDVKIAGNVYPTRYLIGHLCEILLGKLAVVEGALAELFVSTDILR